MCKVEKHELAGLAGGKRDPHRLGIPHLADHDHVRHLPQRRMQRGREIRRVDPDLHLLDDALAVDVFVFDRVFDGDDVFGFALIDRIDDRRQRRRLARPRRPADEHETALKTGQQFGAGRQVQARQRRDLPRQTANRRRRPAALAMQVDAKPADARHMTRGIGDAALAKRALRVRRNLGQHHLFDLDAVERRAVGPDDAPVQAERRRLAGDEQQVAAVALGEQHEPALEPRGPGRRVESDRFELRDESIEIVSRHGSARQHRTPERVPACGPGRR